MHLFKYVAFSHFKLQKSSYKQQINLCLLDIAGIGNSSYHFHCANGHDIDVRLKCDGYDNCGDHSDESASYAGCKGVAFISFQTHACIYRYIDI